jgi:hypothetical protein
MVIAAVCLALQQDAADAASSLLKRDYPFAPEPIIKRQYGPGACLNSIIQKDNN